MTRGFRKNSKNKSLRLRYENNLRHQSSYRDRLSRYILIYILCIASNPHICKSSHGNNEKSHLRSPSQCEVHCNIPSRFINCDFFVSVSIGWFSLHTAGLDNCPNQTRSIIDTHRGAFVSLHLLYNSVARAFRAIR